MPEAAKRFLLNPQVNLSRSTASRMWLIFSCGLAAVIQSSLGDSFASLFVALAALLAALITELLMTFSKYGFDKLKDGSAAASALVLTLLLPNQIHPMYAVIGAVFAVAVVKHSFGGLGSNWMNPALGGWLFIMFSWPQAFSAALNEASTAIPEMPGTAGIAIGQFMNRVFFHFVGAELPPGYIDLFSLHTPGIIADRAVLVLIFATIIIASTQISRSWLSFLYLALFGLLVRFAGDIPTGSSFWTGDVIYAFFSGGTLVTAFILIADPSSGAKSVLGNALMAVFAAVLSMIFRYFGDTFYGCFFAVAIINALTPLLGRLENRILYSHNRIPVTGGSA